MVSAGLKTNFKPQRMSEEIRQAFEKLEQAKAEEANRLNAEAAKVLRELTAYSPGKSFKQLSTGKNGISSARFLGSAKAAMTAMGSRVDALVNYVSGEVTPLKRGVLKQMLENPKWKDAEKLDVVQALIKNDAPIIVDKDFRQSLDNRQLALFVNQMTTKSNVEDIFGALRELDFTAMSYEEIWGEIEKPENQEASSMALGKLFKDLKEVASSNEEEAL